MLILAVPLTLTGLHPAVQKAAGELHADGHYATAIEATKALEVAVREQSGLPAGGNLMGRAFADDDPVPRIHHRRPVSALEHLALISLLRRLDTASIRPAANA